MAKKNFEEYDHSYEMGSSFAKNEYNLFYRKLDVKYFHVRQFFRKEQYFLKKL